MGRWARKPVNHTSWVAVVTPTDRPKSVRNRCLIELFCGVVCVVTLPFWHFCWCRGFCHRTESDLFLFLSDHIQWQPPTDQTLYRTRPFTEFWVVSIEHLRRVWHADRGRLLLRTPDPVPSGLAYVLLIETISFPNLSFFYRTMLFEYPTVLSRFCFVFSISSRNYLTGYF